MEEKKKDREKRNEQKDEIFQKLLRNLKAIIEEAKKKGVELDKRYDLLSCDCCGGFEDIEDDDNIKVFDDEDYVISEDPFIIIDRKEATYRREKSFCIKTTYTYICTACGAYQTQSIREQFDNKNEPI
ncbi:MAG: hypothetical protein K8S27_05050 [Candidatus Omnitrophica bacterium]|nr:hypothetical protein [Candidatus Omnitrophota bacterium]